MIRLGENLRKYRKQKGLTQDELAEKLYVTRQAVSNWENGKNQPDLEMIGEMAKVLEIEAAELLDSKHQEYPRFQKKAVVWAAVLGILTAFLIIDDLYVLPKQLELKGTTYNAWPYMINGFAALPLLRVAAGMFVPAVLSLWYKIQPQGRIKTILWISGIVLLIPPALMMLSLIPMALHTAVPFYSLVNFVLSDQTGLRKYVVMNLFPLFAGICFFLSLVKLKKQNQ